MWFSSDLDRFQISILREARCAYSREVPELEHWIIRMWIVHYVSGGLGHSDRCCTVVVCRQSPDNHNKDKVSLFTRSNCAY